MFGEHYESLLASSGALVDLENDLQSAYMSTKLNQFGLTWNVSNNSKSVENPRKLQLQKMFRIPPSSSMNFLGFFFSISSYFYRAIFVRRCFNLEKGLTLGPPVGLITSVRAHLPEDTGHVDAMRRPPHRRRTPLKPQPS
jgi:hypothetical protein